MGSPTVTPLQEMRHTGGFVVWDPSDGMISREAIVLGAGAGLCTSGLVLAALFAGTATAAALGVNTGNGTFGAITVATAARAGLYSVEFDDGTHFVVSDPTGAEIGHGTVGNAFSAGGIGFTITAGATPFVAADSFAITVVGTSTYGPYNPTATDGHQNAAAILWSGRRDATAAARKAIAVVRGPIRVNASELVWDGSVTNLAQQAAAIAQLNKLGILFT